MTFLRLVLWLHIGLVVLCSAFHVWRTEIDGPGFHSNTRHERKWRQRDQPDSRCGDGLCWCRHTVANCSRVPGGLQHVPHLPGNIRKLYFSYNQLTTIPAHFFHNVTRLIKVDVSHNNLTFISPHAFRAQQHLKFLFLSGNPGLTYQSLSPAFAIPSLEELDIMSCSLGPLPKDLFHNATLPKLKTLLLHDNDVGNFALSIFKPLTALKELGMATNDISAFDADSVLGIEKINLDTNDMYRFPATCNGTSSVFPHLKTLLLQGNTLSQLSSTLCLPRLQTIALGKNMFSQIRTGSFSAHNFPQLVTVSLYSMQTRISLIEKNAFSNPTLQEINLSFNNIKFSSRGIHENSFVDCPHLNKLELPNNRMDMGEEKFVKLFGNLKTITLLNMEKSEIRYLSPRMLSGFRKLTVLLLYRNLLPSLSDGLFDGLHHLQHLDIGHNQIHVVQPGVFSEAVRKRLRSVDLSGNPFSCTCDLLWFKDWLTSNTSVFNGSWTTYNCHNRPNMKVQQFYMAPQACVLSQTTYIVMDVIISLLIFIFVVLFSLVRYRWHIRLLLYEAFRGQGEARRQHFQNNHFEYDVFVTCDVFDEHWVQQHLIPELEGRLHLRLCLPERDLDANRPELDTLSDSLEKSKKVLMLFSNNFVQNQLCQFLLSMCHQHVLDHDDALIIACLDDIAPRDMTAAMISVLRTTPYIQWADEKDAVASFWGRVHIALEEVI